MTDRTCIVDGCDRGAYRREFCSLHYQRVRRHGDPQVFRPDATRGCSVEGCLGAHYGHGLCRLHLERKSKTGDPLATLPHFSPLTGMTGELNREWVGDAAGYEAVHARLRKDHGPAANYACAHCGREAEEWAYDNEDPEERLGTNGLRYSVRGREHYLPLCRPCHKAFDIGWQARRDDRAKTLH